MASEDLGIVTSSPTTPKVVSGRLETAEYERNFGDLHPPLTRHEARVASDRCYFCHDAPCVTACPTAIDIPLFIRQIATGTPEAAAKTIFDQNILGGMCARVCPTETLCEEACVREAAEGKPVEIGRLQRHATDISMRSADHPYKREKPTGKKLAVVGAGPAGLACAHRLAMRGHDVRVLDARPKSGGLNEYGIAAYKTVNDFAQAEIDWLLGIGGIEIDHEKALGEDFSLEDLQEGYDGVFLGLGLSGVNELQIEGSDKLHVESAIDFIAELRQSKDMSKIKVGRNVCVIGGGMTAIDAAIQSKLLGAESVTIAYRGPRERMKASKYEQDLASSKGVRIVSSAMPVRILGVDAVESVEFAYAINGSGGQEKSDETFQIAVDQVFLAIGQRLERIPGALEMDGGKIKVDGQGRTSVSGVWAGGDCASGGDDLTVTAVAQGRDAAENMHMALSCGHSG